MSDVSGSTKLPLECETCAKTFMATKNEIKKTIKSSKNWLRFCSKTCSGASRKNYISFTCDECGTIFQRLRRDRNYGISKKADHIFCSRSCSTTYTNTHKTTGTRRSKLEQWLEQALTAHYPNLQFVFNGKEAINSELDIYIPELKLAFELNGIFHYEAIFGPDKLASIQNNDGRKFQACLERGIELVIIDSSNMKRFSPKHSRSFLDIIKKLIALKSAS